MRVIKGIRDNKIYHERVSRSIPFLGRNYEEQMKAQEILSKAVIGVAGSGGIGGAIAIRLARIGVGKIKLADPDKFEWSNINRQWGANKNNIGKNKATVVADMIHNLSGDTDLEVFEEGITVDNAEKFADGCDIILDEIDFSIVKEKFALHQAFRKSKSCKCILACSVIGWNAILYKYTKDSMPIETWYGFSDDENIVDLSKDNKTALLLKKWSPRFPHFPSFDAVMTSIKETNALPIFAGTPPLAEGFLSQRIVLCLLEKEFPPYAQTLPPIPSIYIYDAATLSGGIYLSDGELKNAEEVNQQWREYDHGN